MFTRVAHPSHLNIAAGRLGRGLSRSSAALISTRPRRREAPPGPRQALATSLAAALPGLGYWPRKRGAGPTFS